MPINNANEIHEKLLYLAILRDSTDKAVRPLQDEIDRLSEKVRTKQLKLDQYESTLRKDILNYIQSTGDLRVHPNVTFRRTKKLVYDRDEMIEYARSHAPRLLRVKEELKVREFEKMWRDGHFPDADVEEVNSPSLEIGRLGDLLIQEEMKNDQ